MNLSDLSIRRPVFAAVVSLLLIVLGIMSFSRLTLRELPAIDPPIVSVEVNYPGASAAVVETRITQVLEDALAGIEGIETVQSSSRDLGRKAMGFAEDNVTASLDFIQKLASARDVQEVVRLQTEFAQAQIKNLADQAKALGGSAAEASKAAFDKVAPKF